MDTKCVKTFVAPMCIYLYIHICSIYTHICIYIYRERERDYMCARLDDAPVGRGLRLDDAAGRALVKSSLKYGFKKENN